MSGVDIDRDELVRKARAQQERLAEYALAVERGEIVDHGDESLPPMLGPDVELAWESAGRTLRELDPVTYRLLHAMTLSFAAVAIAPSEN
jgi:hypothetical protein